MTSPEQNKLSMYLAVLGVMEKFNSVWSALTGIANMVTRLQGFVGQLQSDTGIQGTSQTGVAKGKNRKNLSMVELAAEIAGDLHSLAISLGDDVLANKVDLHLSDLIHLGDAVVGPACQKIHDLAVENATGLLGFNEDAAADTADLQTAIDAYSPLVGQARVAIGPKKQARVDIAATEKKADALLKDELDRSMRKQKRKNAQFFAEYMSARMIIDLGGRHEKGDEPKKADESKKDDDGSSTGTGGVTPPPAK